MGDMSKEPSMEDILSSIRRVIEREDAARVGDEPIAADRPADDSEEPLELTEAAELPGPREGGATIAPYATPREIEPAKSEDGEAILSSDAFAASRQTLASLASLKGEVAAETFPAVAATTIDDLVRECLRPMLKAWLDENLPDMVERIVTREVERITRGDA